jgi:hypothetical protein
LQENMTAEAERIYRDRPDGWEYHLTLEMLQSEMKPVLQRWDALKRGLYSKPSTRVAQRESVEWMLDRIAEAEHLVESFDLLSNEEFAKAWGAPGEAGDADAILSTSRLFAEMCATALEWEERVRFAVVDPAFERVRTQFVGIGGRFIDEAAKLPAFMAAILDDDNASGTHTLNMVLSLPEDWVNDVRAALEEATAEFIANPEQR